MSEETTIETARKIASSSKSPKTGLIVKFEDGTVIAENTAADTLASAFEKIGFPKVMGTSVVVNGEPIVSRTRSVRYNEKSRGGFYIKTHSSTEQKKRNLEDVANQLGLKIRVEIN